MGCCSTRAQVRHAAPVVFPVDFDGGEHVYRIHPINVQLVTDPMIMLAKDEHGCDSGSESLDKHEPRDIFRGGFRGGTRRALPLKLEKI